MSDGQKVHVSLTVATHSLGDLLLRVVLAGGCEGRLAGQQLVHEHSQRPPVYHEVVPLPAALNDFGCHVLHCTAVGVGHLAWGREGGSVVHCGDEY